MKRNPLHWILPLVLILTLLLAIPVSAQNKVVVIPLMEDAKLDPWEPVAAVSPPNNAYTIGTITVTDKVTGLVWQKSDDNVTRSWYDAWDYCMDNTPPLPGTG